MIQRLLILSFIFFSSSNSNAQETIVDKNTILNTQSLLLLKTDGTKQDSTQFQLPKFKQGFFCNFEDQLNRKKVPIDFSLGNSKY